MIKEERKHLEDLQKWEEEYLSKKDSNIIMENLKKVDNFAKPVTRPLADSFKMMLDNELVLKTQVAIQEAIAGAFHFTHDNIKFTYKKDYILNKLELKSFDELDKIYSGEIEKYVKKISNENKIASSIEGFGLGLGGVETTLVEIPIFIALLVRVQQQICACYGFDPESEFEQSYMLKAMSFSSMASIGGRKELQLELNALKVAIKRHTYRELKEMGGKFALPEIAKTFAKQQGKVLSKKKMTQALPVIGGVFGGLMNYNQVHKLVIVTNNLYKRRFIEAKIECLETNAN